MRNDAETVERLLAGQADGSRLDGVMRFRTAFRDFQHSMSLMLPSSAGRTDIVFTRAEGGRMWLHRVVVQIVERFLVSSEDSRS